MKRRFLEFFPPPAFLTMPAIGLSIESEALRVVSFEKKHGSLLLKAAAEYKLEPGTIVSGEIAKPDKLVAALETVRSKHGARFVRVALPEEKAYVYEATLPLPEGTDVSEAVEFTLEQNIPIGPAEASFDFALIGEPFLNNDVTSVRSVVSVYPSGIAENWVEVLKQAGISPIAMSPESQAIAHSVVPNDDKRTVLLTHFFKDKTVIAVVSGGLVRFSTTVVNANSGAGAEKVLAAHEGEKISESVELLAVRDELKKVHSYWKSKTFAKNSKEGIVKSLIVSGHVSNMVDVADYLGKHIATPAMLGNVWQNAFSLDNVVPEIEFNDSLMYSAAVGAALPK